MAVNLCIDCRKSCGLCAWSANFKPVEGWMAEPIKKKISAGVIVDAFHVIDCPLFKPARRPKKNDKWTATETILLKQMLTQKLRHKLIAEVLNKPLNVVEYKIQMLRKGELR